MENFLPKEIEYNELIKMLKANEEINFKHGEEIIVRNYKTVRRRRRKQKIRFTIIKEINLYELIQQNKPLQIKNYIFPNKVDFDFGYSDKSECSIDISFLECIFHQIDIVDFVMSKKLRIIHSTIVDEIVFYLSRINDFQISNSTFLGDFGGTENEISEMSIDHSTFNNFDFTYNKIENKLFIGSCNFNEFSIFYHNTISNKLNIEECSFLKGADFNYLKSNTDAIISISNIRDDSVDTHDGFYFKHINDISIFQITDFYSGNIYLNHSDASEFVFKNVDWNIQNNRIILNDEKSFESDTNESVIKEIKHLEIVYRQLKMNYYNKLDYIIGDMFNASELEMRIKRQKLESILYLFSFESWYKRLSDFGMNWKKPLKWFFVLFVFSYLIILYFEFGYYKTYTFWNSFTILLKTIFAIRYNYEHYSQESLIYLKINQILSYALFGLSIFVIKRKFRSK